MSDETGGQVRGDGPSFRIAPEAIEAADPVLHCLAPAKVNLTLHLCGRRPDGHHLLDSLVAFPEIGDRLSVRPAAALSLDVTGRFADGLTAGPDNLVLRAARALAAHHGERRGAALRLVKNLPVASGIGGGSGDAAAALGLLSALWRVAVPEGLALSLGADVPACRAAPRAMRMRGIGEELTPAPPLPRCWIVLANPGVALSTGAVFAAVRDRAPPAPPAMPGAGFADFAAFAAWLVTQRNDLQAAATDICPVIGEVLAALAGAPVARMSGSGATCFALVADRSHADALAHDLRRVRPGWWVVAAPVG